MKLLKPVKLTSLHVFLILLVVLIISVFFAYVVPKEPFISYNYKANVAIDTAQVSVPPYSTQRAIYRIHDSIYFDPQNGNVIEVFGTPYVNSVDTTGSTLTNMILMPRVGSTVIEYDAEPNVPFSNIVESAYLNSQLVSSYTSWYYPNPSNSSTVLASSIEYQVFYFPWKTDTVTFVQDVMNNDTVGLVNFIGSSIPDGMMKSLANGVFLKYRSYVNTDYNMYVDAIDGYAPPSGTSPKLYCLFYNLWFDTTNGVIIWRNGHLGAGSNIFTDTSLQFSNSQRSNTIINTFDNIVLGIPFPNKRSMVVVLGANSTNPSFMEIINVIRFDPMLPNGIDGTGGNNNVTSSPSSNPATTTSPSSGNTAMTTPSSNHSPTSSSACFSNNNDYISKTQIVPPVCPACPPSGFWNDSSISDIVSQVITQVFASTPTPNPTATASATQTPTATSAPTSVVSTDNTSTDNSGWGAVNKFTGTVGNIATGAEGTFNTAITGATNLGSTAIGGTALLGVGAEGVLANTVNSASNLASNAMGDVTQLGTGAEKIIYNGENAIGNVATGVVGGVSSLGNKILDTTGNIIAGGTASGNGGMIGDASATNNKYYGNVPGFSYMLANVYENEDDSDDEEENNPSCKETFKVENGSPTNRPALLYYNTPPGPGINDYFGAIPYRGTTDFQPMQSSFSAFGR